MSVASLVSSSPPVVKPHSMPGSGEVEGTRMQPTYMEWIRKEEHWGMKDRRARLGIFYWAL
jgi:hypothetical protein